MRLAVPSEPKVRTTVYDNFKGVDFTNDSTNVWHRRSPDGFNMLPDESGRPFKRTGWEVVVSSSDLATALSKDSVTILKCHYFELAGIDHIIIFTDGGVFKYAEDTLSLLTGSTDIDCFSSYDRAFFFEGDGKSAFYIYGNYRVWVYEYNEGSFTFAEATDIYVPKILVGTNPSDCSGTQLESYNLLGNKAQVWYQNNDMFYFYTTGEISVNVDKTDFDTKLSLAANPDKVYTFTYSSSQWNLDIDGTPSVSNVTLAEYGVSIMGTPSNDDTIVVLYIYGVLLPNNVTSGQKDDVEVYSSTLAQFDTELTVLTSGAITSGKCLLCTDEYSFPDTKRKAWIRFAEALNPVVDEEDAIEVVFPIKTVDVTNYPVSGHETDCQKTGTATINT